MTCFVHTDCSVVVIISDYLFLSVNKVCKSSMVLINDFSAELKENKSPSSVCVFCSMCELICRLLSDRSVHSF